MGALKNQFFLTATITHYYLCLTSHSEEDEAAGGPAITGPDGTAVDVPSDTSAPPAGEKKEEALPEEEEGPQFTEDEDAIVQYLREDEPLPPELLDKIVADWWTKEPFK